MLTQPALFDLPDPTTATAKRDRQMAAVAEAAERARAHFQRDARAFVLQFLAAQGPTAGEVITLACKAAGIAPHDDRAFGSVYFELAKTGRIAKTGEQVARRRGNCTSGGNVWALTRAGGH